MLCFLPNAVRCFLPDFGQFLQAKKYLFISKNIHLKVISDFETRQIAQRSKSRAKMKSLECHVQTYLGFHSSPDIKYTPETSYSSPHTVLVA